MNIMEHDSIRLLVILPRAEFAHQLVRVGMLVAEDPQSMPPVLALPLGFTDDDGAHSTHVAVTLLATNVGRGLGNGDGFGWSIIIRPWL